MRRLIVVASVVTAGLASSAQAQTPAPAPYPTQATQEASTHPYDLAPKSTDAERIEFWNSPEMREARDYVINFSRRSKRTSPSQGQRYLEQVSRLSVPAMKQWLEQLQAVRKAREGHQQLSEAARQIRVDRVLQRIDATQQAPFNAQQSKMMIAEYAQQLAAAKQLAEGEVAPRDRQAEIAAALEAQRLKFDPFAPATDPASPDAYTRYAAAAALPGDLPRGDPANSGTGEGAGGAAGVDAAAGSGAAGSGAASGSGVAGGSGAAAPAAGGGGE